MAAGRGFYAFKDADGVDVIVQQWKDVPVAYRTQAKLLEPGKLEGWSGVPASERSLATQGGQETRPPDPTIAARVPVDPAIRTRPPGSDWLYVKLYGGTTALDDVLTEVVPALLQELSAQGVLSRWFFIRYGDPHTHLRIRFKSPEPRGSSALLPLVSAAFNPQLAAGRLWKIQFDTYEREIERYGGVDGLSAAEEIFCADSDAVLSILGR